MGITPFHGVIPSQRGGGNSALSMHPSGKAAAVMEKRREGRKADLVDVSDSKGGRRPR